MKVTVLGCGASTGVPMVGNDWGACDPGEPRNMRQRSAILMEFDDKAILVDAGADVRGQLLTANVTRLDAVIFTHEHADHTLGVDDLRAFLHLNGRSLDIYGTDATLASIRQRFAYMFERHGNGKTFLTPHVIAETDGLPQYGIETFGQKHHRWISLGIRRGQFVYSTDVQALDETQLARLKGIDTWIVAALRREPHPAHGHLSLVLEWIRAVRPRKAYLTHMNSSLDYRSLLAELPPGVEPAYDGLALKIDD